MCGIVGYIGEKDAVPILLEGLKRLEYRGYDSAGVAVVAKQGIDVRRAKGKIAKLENLLAESPIRGCPGIGHTRWATHGRPSEENAHPHAVGKVALVHNGIIENFAEIRSYLLHRGRKLSSETDTETVAHLIDLEMEEGKNLLDATFSALQRIHGSYAIAVITSLEPDKIVVAKSSSPLIIALGQGHTMIASDIPAMIGFSQEMIVMDDGEIGVVTKDGYQGYDAMSREVKKKKIVRMDMSPAMAEKGGFKHFMLKEIFEQPRAIIDTMRGRMCLEAGDVDFGDEGPQTDVLRRVNRLHLCACGTSWHACLVGKYLISAIARIPVDVHLGSEFDIDIAMPSQDDLFVAVSQSGETIDTLKPLRMANQASLTTVGICNVVASSVARESRFVIYTHAGPEISVASTKAFTTQIVVLYLLAVAIGRAKGVLDKEKGKKLLDDLLLTPGKVEEVLKEAQTIREIGQRYMNTQHMLFLGRGIMHPVALEGALKLKEISYIHAEGYSAGEMKHGPIALIDELFPTLLLAPRYPNQIKVIGNMEEVKARGGKVIAVATRGDEMIERRADDIIRLPECPHLLLPIVATPPLQLLAYSIADLKGTDVDQPRNLAKSVTVE